VPQTESRDNFIPTDHERRVLLELLQSPQESLESIANVFKITLAALTIYLATDDAASLFAQADLANARRARTAAAAQLEKCIGALSLMVDDYISDVTHNLQRETPKSRREQDRQRETTRRAATVLYRIANFTPRTLTVPISASPNKNPARQRGATDAPIAPPAPESQPLTPRASILPASTSPQRERAGCHAKSDIDASPIPPRISRTVTRCAANHAAASPRDPAAPCSSHVASLNPEPASSSSRAPPSVLAPA
jgi:hypothetical protein